MKKRVTLIWLLRIMSVCSLVNIFTMALFLDMLPFGSFNLVRLSIMAFGFIMLKPIVGCCLLVAILSIILLLFFASFSIQKNKLLLPACSLCYLVVDFALILNLFFDTLNLPAYYSWRSYGWEIIFTGSVILLLAMYLWERYKTRIA